MPQTPDVVGLTPGTELTTEPLLNLLLSALSDLTITDVRMRGSLSLSGEYARTIASGAIDIRQSTGSRTQRHSSAAVDTESAAATDDLDTISGGIDGQILVLRATDATHTVVVKNGTGNIVLPADVSLDSNDALLILWYNSTLSKWLSTSRTYLPLTTKTGAYTATTLDHVIRCDASGGAFTITLPPAAGLSGFDLYIIKVDGSGNAVTVDGNGSETINLSVTFILGAHDAIHIVCDGSNWDIM